MTRSYNKTPKEFKEVAQMLLAVSEGAKMTQYVRGQMQKQGLITLEKETNGRRGRPAYKLGLTGKARGMVAMARRWQA